MTSVARRAAAVLAPAFLIALACACRGQPPAPDGPPEATGPAPAPASGTGPGAAPAAAAPEPPAEAPSFVGEQNRREVSIFFQKADSDHLGPERRKIFQTSSPADQAKQIVIELINGPRASGLRPTIPPKTRLLGLYLDRTGTVYVDLSQELVDNHPGGSTDELATLFSLVDSITYNLPEIKKVHFLVGGEEREVLKGHLDLRRDYIQDLSLVEMGGST